MDEALARGEVLPINIEGQAIYYMGPSPAREGRPIGSAGLRHQAGWISMRQNCDMGLAAMIGKGKRSQEVLDAIIKNKSVYLAAVGLGRFFRNVSNLQK